MGQEECVQVARVALSMAGGRALGMNQGRFVFEELAWMVDHQGAVKAAGAKEDELAGTIPMMQAAKPSGMR